jgi:hypothetical protein
MARYMVRQTCECLAWDDGKRPGNGQTGESGCMHVAVHRDMDRAHIQDREKWKRETLQKIKETKIQMMKLTGG